MIKIYHMIQRLSDNLGSYETHKEMVLYTDHLADKQVAIQLERRATATVSFQKQDRIDALIAGIEGKGGYKDVITMLKCSEANLKTQLLLLREK